MKEKLERQRDYLQIWFERKFFDERYRHVLFSHVGLWLPPAAEMWEVVGNPLGCPQGSADVYMPEDVYVLVTDFELNEAGLRRAQHVLESSVGSYSGCYKWANNVLRGLDISVAAEPQGVDELFYHLSSRYRFSVTDVKEHYEAVTA